MRADKQQEDLDLPYLLQNQPQPESQTTTIYADSGGHRASQSSLAVSQSQSSLAGSQQSATTNKTQQGEQALKLEQTSTIQDVSMSTITDIGDHSSSQIATKMTQKISSNEANKMDSQVPSVPTHNEANLTGCAQPKSALESTSNNKEPLKSVSVIAAQDCKHQIDSITTSLSMNDSNNLKKNNENYNQDSACINIQPFGTLSNTAKSRLNELRKLLRHTESLKELPEFGVETSNEKELTELMDQIDVWGLNIFEVHRISNEHSLTVVMYKIFEVSFKGTRRKPLFMGYSENFFPEYPINESVSKLTLFLYNDKMQSGEKLAPNLRYIAKEVCPLPSYPRGSLSECPIS